jgi:tetratricopeptide (TPR) repeat protein
MDLVMQDPTGGQWKSLRTCDSMVVAQEALAATRRAAKATRDTGRARKERCLGDDSAGARKCLESLSGLRSSLRRLVRAEDSIRSDVGRFASACPAAGWRRRVEYHGWERTRDSTCQVPDDTGCGRILSQIASVAWIPDWRHAPRAGTPPRKTPPVRTPRALEILDSAIDHPGVVPGRDTLLARSAFLLRRAGFEDSARVRFQRLLAEFPASAWSSSAHLALGQSIALSPEMRMEHLRSALSDSVLNASALASEIDLLEADGHPAEAADSLVELLRRRPDLADPPMLFRLANLSEKGLLEPDEIQSRLVPPMPWADALYLLQIRLELRANHFKKALGMLAGFQVRFPNSGLCTSARDLLARARRRDPGVLGPLQK